ncbi:MAG: glycosyltransferase [Geminicoccaceae bacterium]|nr:MAG: glycosyltransferase [Geminicoccaceae bacterium]
MRLSSAAGRAQKAAFINSEAPLSPTPAPWLAPLLDPALDPAFWPPVRVDVASAWWSHVPFAQALVAAAPPATLVELGTHNGVSYLAFLEAVQRLGLATACVAIDTWQGDAQAGAYDETVHAALKALHGARYGGFSRLLRATFDEAVGQFDDGSIDLLHIDGLHTYAAVRHDFETWRPKLSARGVVLFHDTEVRERDFGVWRLWDELRQRYPSFGFLHGFGLGVLAVGAEAPPAVLALCALGEAEQARVRARFEALGARWQALAEATDQRAAHDRAQGVIAALEHARAAAVLEAERTHDALARVQADNARLDAARASAERRANEAKAELAAVLGSTSWRVTAPIRNAKLALARRPQGAVAAMAARAMPVNVSVPAPAEGETRPRLVVVVHEASRTGAPILALDLVRRLEGRYAVLALLLNDGPLLDDFAATASGMVLVRPGDQVALPRVIERVVQSWRPRFAIANSAVTHPAVPPLVDHGVPVVALVHEFSVNLPPRGVLDDLYRRASEVVFPAELVAAASVADYPVLAQRGYHVLPQGQVTLPAAPADADDARATRAKLEARVPAEAFLVIGLGSVIFRKGVDLFVAAATRVRSIAPDQPIHFLWVGHSSVHAADYRAQIDEQILRAGLADDVTLLDEVRDLEPIYGRAGALFLASRLDPLPNICIDAAVRGLPVVGFAAASGMAELLAADARTADLVVPHLDAAAAGERLVQLARSPERRETVAVAMRELAAERFDAERYVGSLVALGEHGSLVVPGEQVAARRRIREAGVFDAELFSGHPVAAEVEDAVIDLYLAGVDAIRPLDRPGIGNRLRRPMRGFHPLRYAEACPDFEARGKEDPLDHFLRAGRPQGPWLHPVLEPAPQAGAGALRVVLHGHFHYPEFVGELLERLRFNRTAVDLVLTTDTDVKAGILRERLASVGRDGVSSRLMPNRGRDIGPFLALLAEGAFDGYDVVGHVHGKKSAQFDPCFGDRWRRFLWEHLIGGRHRMVDTVVAGFEADAKLGLVFAEEPHLNDWDANRTIAETLAERVGCEAPLPINFDFPMGTMFWARRSALRPLLDLNLGWDDYPHEPVAYDGTILHALERLLPFVADKAGFTYATTHVAGSTR